MGLITLVILIRWVVKVPKAGLVVVRQLQREVMPNLAEVPEEARQTAVRQAKREVPLYSVQEQAVAVDAEVDMLVQMVVNGAVRLLLLHIPLAAVELLVGLRQMVRPVVMDAEMAAEGQLVSKLVQAAMAELLEVGEEEVEAPLLLALAVPMAATVAMEP